MDPQTLEFYQTRSQEWADALPYAYSPQLDAFLDRLPPGARILELGCGDGRDAERMIARDFDVHPTDGSPEMARMAAERLGRDVRVMLFQELDAVEEYDAVWAYASLLHVPAEELPDILVRIWRALKPGGLHLGAFKGGEGGGRDQFGRFYSYIPQNDLRSSYQTAGNWDIFTLESEVGGSYGGGPTPWYFVTLRKASI